MGQRLLRLAQAGVGAGRLDRPPRGRLEARRSEKSYEFPSQARGKRRRARLVGLAAFWIDGAAGVVQAEQPADLVERLARRVVHVWPSSR